MDAGDSGAADVGEAGVASAACCVVAAVGFVGGMLEVTVEDALGDVLGAPAPLPGAGFGGGNITW